MAAAGGHGGGTRVAEEAAEEDEAVRALAQTMRELDLLRQSMRSNIDSVPWLRRKPARRGAGAGVSAAAGARETETWPATKRKAQPLYVGEHPDTGGAAQRVPVWRGVCPQPHVGGVAVPALLLPPPPSEDARPGSVPVLHRLDPYLLSLLELHTSNVPGVAEQHEVFLQPGARLSRRTAPQPPVHGQQAVDGSAGAADLMHVQRELTELAIAKVTQELTRFGGLQGAMQHYRSVAQEKQPSILWRTWLRYMWATLDVGVDYACVNFRPTNRIDFHSHEQGMRHFRYILCMLELQELARLTRSLQPDVVADINQHIVELVLTPEFKALLEVEKNAGPAAEFGDLSQELLGPNMPFH